MSSQKAAPASVVVPTGLQRSPGTALHRQLYIVLRDQILRGTFPAGAAIPKEADLEQMFGVSRITVRRAVADLESHGLVRKVPSKGTFVLPRKDGARREATLTLLEALTRQAEDTQVQVLSVETVHAPGDIALLLELEPNGVAHHVVRLRSAGKTPLMVTDAWVLAKWAQDLTPKTLLKNALFEIILSKGVKFGKVVQEFSAILADPQQASLLKTDVGSPLIKVTRLFYDAQDRPAYHLTSVATPERTRLLMEIPASAINTLSAGSYQHTVLV
ncbi:GntR family transcriptional regulator [Variovorax sp. RA8]|uniref:GntR family transcriptional regulator n=1 Tax=Variovorax sp. (strain JCM 16519 / RA8) TaxID=662548 RepID=UPI001318F7AD|nr:GntR family transcriptional regulator [Variovorax sp. RA8]VTU43075.1 putative HTH-type transcriptional regulator YidP [Variovorax sp. RA8]